MSGGANTLTVAAARDALAEGRGHRVGDHRALRIVGAAARLELLDEEIANARQHEVGVLHLKFEG
jgi:hypothetical protein